MPDFPLSLVCVCTTWLNTQVYGVVDEAAHKAAGGLPVVRVAQALIKAPIEEVALCWWQAGRRKVRTDSFAPPSAFTAKIDLVCVVLVAVFFVFLQMGGISTPPDRSEMGAKRTLSALLEKNKHRLLTLRGPLAFV